MKTKKYGYRYLTRGDLKRALAPIKTRPWFYAKTTIQPISLGIILIWQVSLLKQIINSIESGQTSLALQPLMIFAIISLVGYVIFAISRNRTWSELYPNTLDILGRKYLREFVKVDNNEAEKMGTGRLIDIINKGVSTQTDIIAEVCGDHSKSIVIVISSALVVFSIDRVYGIIFCLLTVAYMMLSIVLENKKNVRRVRRKNHFVERSRHQVKIIMSKFEILQNDKFDVEEKQISERFKNVRLLNYRIGDRHAVSNISTMFLQDRTKIAVIAIVGMGIRIDRRSVGEFVSLITILYIFDDVIRKLGFAYFIYTRKMVDIKKMRAFFDDTKQIQGYDEGKSYLRKDGTVELKNLSFSYNEREIIFEDLSLKIKGGKKTAFVGVSGAGKSTLIKLIAGYIRPDRGDIIVDGQNLNDVALKSYYKQIGYLTQDPSIFDGTVRENLSYAIEGDVDEKAIQKAIQDAKCEFIYDFQDGVDTEIGERGIRLSGGQRQRLAIAKVFLKNPEIVLLDEPTSALDSFSEEAVTEAMNNLFVGRTVIVIAHRLQTVKSSDDIIVFEQGKVIERGTHDELVKSGGHYAKMLELQSGF